MGKGTNGTNGRTTTPVAEETHEPVSTTRSRAITQLNQVMIEGYLGGDPELRHTSTGSTVINFRIANSRSSKTSADGSKTAWFPCTAWDALAELCHRALRKGSHVIVIGRLEQETWVDRETGQNRRKDFILVTDIRFLGGLNENFASGSSAAAGEGNEEIPI